MPNPNPNPTPTPTPTPTPNPTPNPSTGPNPSPNPNPSSHPHQALIARIGAASLEMNIGTPKPPTQARLFDKCLKSITFTMVSVEAGNAFLRRLAMKVYLYLLRPPLPWLSSL